MVYKISIKENDHNSFVVDINSVNINKEHQLKLNKEILSSIEALDRLKGLGGLFIPQLPENFMVASSMEVDNVFHKKLILSSKDKNEEHNEIIKGNYYIEVAEDSEGRWYIKNISIVDRAFFTLIVTYGKKVTTESIFKAFINFFGEEEGDDIFNDIGRSLEYIMYVFKNFERPCPTEEFRDYE